MTSRDIVAQHDPDGEARLSTTLVHALADAMGVDVTDSDFVLADSIDPDALDVIFNPLRTSSTPSRGHVAFGIEGYRVTVYSDGEIIITPPTGSTMSTA